jgi:DNA mismatch endonuclease, patch repair protein
MPDCFDPATRSRIMASIHGQNTKPEILLRKALFARGFRYSLHPKNLMGHPDIFLPKWGAVIFVHGCFWHGHNCGHVRLPRSNSHFWKKKITKNIARDKQTVDSIAKDGWRVCCVWECALKYKRPRDINNLADKVTEWLYFGGKKKTYLSRRQ